MALPKIVNNIENKINRSGDTMEGRFILKESPLQDLEASTKKYVDDSIVNNILIDTESSSVINGDPPEIDVSILNKINEKVNPVQDLLNNHINNKEDPHAVAPEQIGALSLAGGTLTGNLTINKTTGPSLFLKTTSKGVSAIQNGSNDLILLSANDSNLTNYNRLVIFNSNANKVDPLQFHTIVNGETTGAYPIYGGHNKEYIRNYLYPVGTVVCMATNTNPSTLYGGTWSLIDKQFKTQRITITPTLTEKVSAATVYAYLSDHKIDLQINITPAAAITDTTVNLITIDPKACGATAFGSSSRWYTSFSDVSNVVICYVITTAGVVSIRDVLVRGSSSANLAKPTESLSNFQIIVSLTSISQMVDSFCNRFYFQRTA